MLLLFPSVRKKHSHQMFFIFWSIRFRIWRASDVNVAFVLVNQTVLVSNIHIILCRHKSHVTALCNEASLRWPDDMSRFILRSRGHSILSYILWHHNQNKQQTRACLITWRLLCYCCCLRNTFYTELLFVLNELFV